MVVMWWSFIKYIIIYDKEEEGLETEVIHVMFYIEVYKVALGPSVYMNHMPHGIIV